MVVAQQSGQRRGRGDTRRLLAIQARAANFVEVRYRVSETPPGEHDPQVRDR
jgi:hypothetical protein